MLAQQDALHSTAAAQQDNYGLLLRQLTEIQLSHDTLQRITSAADDMQELQNAMGSMMQRHAVHEQLFYATDDHIRQLYGKHVALMDMLQKFERQQSQRWQDHVTQYESQQASLRAVMDKLSQTTVGMDESGLTSLRRELDLLHEAVGSLQSDHAATDAKLHECLVRLSAISAIPGSGEGSSSAGAPSHPQVTERIRDELQGHARQAEFFMKQLLEERRAREALELRLGQEAEQRKLLESRISLLESSRYHMSAPTRGTPTESVPMRVSLSPTVTRESDQLDESDPEQQWWFQSGGPPGLRAPPPPLPEEMRKQTVENPANQMRHVFGTALGVDLSQHCNAGSSQSAAQGTQTGGFVAEKGCELPVAGNTGAPDANKDEGRIIPEGRWKMLRDIPQLNLAVGQAWEAGIYVQSWHTQCSTIFHSIAESFAEFADRMWKAAMVMYKQKSESLIMPVPPMISAEDKDFEARLSGALMRVVPEEIKVSAIEGAMGQLVSSAMLYMGVLARLQPAGPEEASSLLSFVRSPPIASSARELEGLFRRYRLALRRLVQLSMPEVAPSEQLKALQLMTRTLERKYPAFHMRMNLLRLKVWNDTLQEQEQQEFYQAAEGEISNMLSNEVWVEVNENSTDAELRRALGWGDDVKKRVPKPIPMKLVLTKKPVIMPEDLISSARKNGAKAASEQVKNCAYKPRCRLVACGNFQRSDSTDSAELSSENISAEGVRMLFNELAFHDSWEAMAFDVSCAFLNSKLPVEERVLLRPPNSLIKLGFFKPGTLLAAHRSVYGLRRGPVDWQDERQDKQAKVELPPAEGDELPALEIVETSCQGLYTVREVESRIIRAICAMFVDDGFCVGEREALLRYAEHVDKCWKTKFQGILSRLKDRSPAIRGSLSIPMIEEITFIGVQVTFQAGLVATSQRKWLLQELDRRGLTHLAGVQCLPDIPEGKILPRERTDSYQQELKLAQQEIGSLQWIALKTRPDIQSTVGQCASLASLDPSIALKVTKALWRYLRGTAGMTLNYKHSADTTLLGSSDASFSPGGGRSRSGSVILFGGNAIGWKSCRQSLTAYSTCEAECEAMATCTGFLTDTAALLQELTNRPIEMRMENDNSSAVCLLTRARFTVQGWRTRHYAIRAAWTRDQHEHHAVSLQHVPGKELVSDMLTKSLNRAKLEQHAEKIGLTRGRVGD
ncbi:RE1 [Symbiodinium sp. CCMP2592]|nr:RE1 [Symbiodinium sp. CCMP2592]